VLDRIYGAQVKEEFKGTIAVLLVEEEIGI
jgi:hypothetical protein